MDTQTNAYVLGHEQHELRRLREQSDHYRFASQTLLVAAGLEPGMRVLDLGCGPGDLSLLAARLVGPSGHVVGVERSADAISLARARGAAEGLEQLRFVEGDANRLRLEDLTDAGEPFDAVIGRFVLMYVPEPAGLLRSLRRLLRPTGIVTFQEVDVSTATGTPRGALFHWGLELASEAMGRSGVDVQFGRTLPRLFVEAGLPTPQTQLLATVQSGADAYAHAHVAETVRTLLPAIKHFQLADPEQLDIDNLEQRMRDEATRDEAMIVNAAVVGAWARLAPI